MKPISPELICFGLNRERDTQSFSSFLQLAGQPLLAETLAKRLSSEEMKSFVDDFTHLLKKHLSSKEYHALFLRQQTEPKPSLDIKE